MYFVSCLYFEFILYSDVVFLKQNYAQKLPKLIVSSRVSLLSPLIRLLALTPLHLGYK